MKKIILTSVLSLTMVGCQSLSTSQLETQKPPVAVSTAPAATPPSSGVKIKPYEQEEIQRKSIALPPNEPSKVTPPQPTPPKIILPQQQQNQQNFDDGHQVPAVRGLLQQAEIALQQKNINHAERLTLQAQRLAPQSAQSYLILAKIALIKNNPANARSLAQRGLSFAQDKNIQRQLNQMIEQTQ
ncbi:MULTISPECIES: tetratricopeptide repeat protein [unclassified Acinetobacter]|uniref:tetratricopeptide repeat protein n=1 Tax=unclassified Acinetobacter TaxID=196816 RepID=UPI002934DF6A|nr:MULTISPECIES: tetratricopeptide repeat protein [unclassified Acinetobacter]WOE32375.1 tetratricopeptide repeat protein [Acinetobacter sp. SAAs470]WOE37848.1 tetratricopeptide repeat protein [Acinetobacter sp. SAAs474]